MFSLQLFVFWGTTYWAVSLSLLSLSWLALARWGARMKSGSSVSSTPPVVVVELSMVSESFSLPVYAPKNDTFQSKEDFSEIARNVAGVSNSTQKLQRRRSCHYSQ